MTDQFGTTSRSATFFGESGVAGFTHRAFTKSMGYDDIDMGRPVIGICNTYSELNNCNRHLRDVAEAVKRGVWQAGGFPLEFPTISLGEIFLDALPQPGGHGHRRDDSGPADRRGRVTG
jgi:dihydroxyacid dehydratase/phosphogluconate dehydratase